MEKVPRYKSDKFECPHCEVTASQYWFDAASAASRTSFLIQHHFLSYRTRIRDHQQETIQNFIDDSKDKIESGVKVVVPANFSIATCAACEDFTLWIDRSLIYPKKYLYHNQISTWMKILNRFILRLRRSL